MTLDRWLTPKRLRAHAMLLALAIWGIYAWTLATPTLRDRTGSLKGTDFLHFYTLGSLARAHEGDKLYDIDAQARLAAQRMPDARGIRYLPLYPPQLSILFAPLAFLSYAWALALWWLTTSFIYFACCYWIWRCCPALLRFAGSVFWAALAFPAFFHLIAWGQTSALALACFTAGFFQLREKREFAAGLALGCLIFKPQLGLAAGIVFLLLARWRIVIGAAISAAAQFALAIAYYGIVPLRSWLQTLRHVPAIIDSFEPRPYQTHCLRTFWAMLVRPGGVSSGLWLISVTVVLWWTITIWRKEERLSLKYSALLLATVLVSPHLTVYDLVILAPATLLLADWVVAGSCNQGGAGTLLYCVYLLPLVGPWTRWIHVQLSVIAMTALLYLLWRIRPKEQAAIIPGSQQIGAVTL